MSPVMRSVAMISLHTSPLAQPGVGDSGGMNVFVRELGGGLARAGVGVRCYVRRTDPDDPDEIQVEPGFDLINVTAGPLSLAKEDLPSVIDQFADRVGNDIADHSEIGVVHANYWLSAAAGHQIKHRLDLPLVTTFHTLARVKSRTGDAEPDQRAFAEASVVGCSDVITAATASEALELVDLYGADPERIELIAPGVDRAFFSPGDRSGARWATGLPDEPTILFVGRIQPLKGLDLAIEALGHMASPCRLVVVGGSSGVDGAAELARVRAIAKCMAVEDHITWIDPQPHHLLSSYYRSADVVVVPSRSESFGLVALEAAACGVPVVAADVGGLSHVVADGYSGLLVAERSAESFAGALDRLLNSPWIAGRMGAQAARRAERFTWSAAAARLRRCYGDLSTRSLVECDA